MKYRTEDFVADGALRDICVFDVDLEDWDRVIASLLASGWKTSFMTSLPGGSESLLENAEELFSRLAFDGEATATLGVLVGGIWFTCYFFAADQIEFTFDPGSVVDEVSFRSVEKFMTWLGETSVRVVIMTMEGTDHRSMPVLLEYVPA